MTYRRRRIRIQKCQGFAEPEHKSIKASPNLNTIVSRPRRTPIPSIGYAVGLDPVIYLDWTGLDPCSNPVHPNKISFGSWSSTKIQTIQCKIYTKNSRSWHIFGVSMTDRW